MINLLPPKTKENYRYARFNARLVRWITGASLALLGTVVIVAVGIVVLDQLEKSQARQVSDTNQKLAKENVEETKKQVDTISNNTKLSLQVLSKEILFSKLLRQLGSSIPANTELQSFQVDKLQGGLTLTAVAADINAATQLQLNLQDPKNKVFEKADIENINCSGDTGSKRLPCTVQIRALFIKNNPFLYITPPGSGTSHTEKKP